MENQGSNRWEILVLWLSCRSSLRALGDFPLSAHSLRRGLYSIAAFAAALFELRSTFLWFLPDYDLRSANLTNLVSALVVHIHPLREPVRWIETLGLAKFTCVVPLSMEQEEVHQRSHNR